MGIDELGVESAIGDESPVRVVDPCDAARHSGAEVDTRLAQYSYSATGHVFAAVIANAFNEVTDPEEQLCRWKGEMAERKRLGTGDLPMDLEMIESLKAGIPPAGGIALGLERLYMALFAVTDIRELAQFFP